MAVKPKSLKTIIAEQNELINDLKTENSIFREEIKKMKKEKEVKWVVKGLGFILNNYKGKIDEDVIKKAIELLKEGD